LTDDHKIDLTLNAWLVSEAAGKPCTFHRAFDELEGEADEIELQLEVLIKCGFKAVLTSGGAPNAVEGRQRLARLVERANGRIDVIVGGGVRSDNVEVLRETGASWFHSSAIVDGGEVASGQEVRALKEKLDSWH
jgi:copper homeostasis protein